MRHFKIIIKKDRLVFYTRVWKSQWRRVANGKFIYCFLPCKNPNFYTIRLLYKVNKYLSRSFRFQVKYTAKTIRMGFNL